MALETVSACSAMFRNAVAAFARRAPSAISRTATTPITVAQVGTTRAAARYGIKAIEPLAEFGIATVKNSAMRASTDRRVTAKRSPPPTLGEIWWSMTVLLMAAMATTTLNRSGLRFFIVWTDPQPLA